jgi:1,4-alpha-glucan branching enzyme
MTIHFDTDAATGNTTATFTIEGHDQTPVSVVGSFNDWTPGQHTFESAEEGLLSATVPVHPGDELHFRYLAADGHWFDDPEADSITEHGFGRHSSARFGAANRAYNDPIRERGREHPISAACRPAGGGG